MRWSTAADNDTTQGWRRLIDNIEMTFRSYNRLGQIFLILSLGNIPFAIMRLYYDYPAYTVIEHSP